MSLSEYQKKRSFSKTPEPEGAKPAAAGDKLVFVVQKHHASHLHYDFRLEMKGTLKSWAVPKGPSINPADKRLAMLVEDHPFDYKDFEGIIPSGNYGAGTVIIWDQGTYEPAERKTGKAEQEKILLKQFYGGTLRIILKGKKLKGEFVLVQSKTREDNSWLLMKKEDEFALDIDITASDKSVVSGKTIEQIRDDKKSKKWISNRTADGKLKPEVSGEPKDSGTISKTGQTELAEESPSNPDFGQVAKEMLASLGLTKTSRIPATLQPMLATLTNSPVDDPGWMYEVLWDGLRAVTSCNKGKVKIRIGSRDIGNERFAPLHTALQQWGLNAVLDGEIVVINKEGLSSLGDLQNWRNEDGGELVFYVFDMLWLEGADLQALPLSQRREMLEKLLPQDSIVRLSDNFEASGTDFFEAARKMNLKGIVAKKADSRYLAGTRTKEWLKIKTLNLQKAIIAGYTSKPGTGNKPETFILALFENGILDYVGETKPVISGELQTDMLTRLKPLIINESPFSGTPSKYIAKGSKEITWVKPEIVCEVTYGALTKSLLRDAEFHGVREDKLPEDITWENPVSVSVITGGEPSKTKIPAPTPKNKIPKPKPAKEKSKTFLNPKEETQIKLVNGHELKFTNLGKLYWPKEQITKRDMLNYYYEVLPYMLPYMKDRPQSLNRHPGGIHGENFYQKNVSGKVEPWITTHDYQNTSKEGNKTFLVCTDEASLLYIAKLGCIEMNPWHSRLSAPDNPDWCVVDLDPDTNSFEQVIEVANVVKKILDAIDVPCYPKTSGSTGMHLYIPLGAKYDYDQSKQLAELIVTLAHQELPGFTSVERNPAKRKGKIYLDFLQNRPIQTIAAPYSLRPKPGATASAPLLWEEVKNGLSIAQFNISNMLPRIKEMGDLFTGVLDEGIDLGKVLEKASGVFG